MGLFSMAGQVLRYLDGFDRLDRIFHRPGGILMTYGPYAVDGVLSPESNQQVNRCVLAMVGIILSLNSLT